MILFPRYAVLQLKYQITLLWINSNFWTFFSYKYPSHSITITVFQYIWVLTLWDKIWQELSPSILSSRISARSGYICIYFGHNICKILRNFVVDHSWIGKFVGGSTELASSSFTLGSGAIFFIVPPMLLKLNFDVKPS